MKKLLLVIASLIITTNVSAQFTFGFKCGFNFSTITNDNDARIKPSVYAGILGEYTFGNIFGLQPEVVYSRQGAFARFDGYRTWVRMNYFNMAVMAKFYVMKNLSIDIGPQYGLLVNATFKVKEENVFFKRGKGNIRNKVKESDFSLGVGCSYRWSEICDVTVRYYIGMSDFSKNQPWELESTNKNRVLQVGMGVRF